MVSEQWGGKDVKKTVLILLYSLPMVFLQRNCIFCIKTCQHKRLGGGSGFEPGMSGILNITAEHLNALLGSVIADFIALFLFGNYMQIADIRIVH